MKRFRLIDLNVKRRMLAEAANLPTDPRTPPVVIFKEDTRNLDQNAAQWPILQALSEQLRWPVNGELVYMSDTEWKDVLTAAFYGEQMRLAQGVDGGVVMLGRRTSKMGKKEFSEWLEYLHWFCSEKSVNLTEQY